MMVWYEWISIWMKKIDSGKWNKWYALWSDGNERSKLWFKEMRCNEISTVRLIMWQKWNNEIMSWFNINKHGGCGAIFMRWS